MGGFVAIEPMSALTRRNGTRYNEGGTVAMSETTVRTPDKKQMSPWRARGDLSEVAVFILTLGRELHLPGNGYFYTPTISRG